MKKRIVATVALAGPLLVGLAAPVEAAPTSGYEILDHDQQDEDEEDHDHDGDGKPDHDPEDHEEDEKPKPKDRS